MTTVRNSLRRSPGIHAAAILVLLITGACGAQWMNPKQVNLNVFIIGFVAASLGMGLEMMSKAFTDERPPGPHLLATCVGGGFVGVVGGLSALVMLVLLFKGIFQAGNFWPLCVLPPFIVMLAVEYWFAIRFIEDVVALVKHLETDLALLASTLVVAAATIISVFGAAILFWVLVG